jgi:hypothetical protein
MTTLTTSAPGAVQLSSPLLIPTSPATACQSARNPTEPASSVSTCKPRAVGNEINRRTALNMIVGTAAIGTASPLEAVADPIFAAIKAHKAAHAVLEAAVHRHSELEQSIPRDKRQSKIEAGEEEIVESDDPQWIEAERELHHAFDAETDAACELVTIKPTTPAGMVALLRYAIEADTDGMGWPDGLQSDDGKLTRSWHYFLIENIAETFAESLAA